MNAEWFQQAFEHMLEGIIIMDNVRRIEYMNPLANQMTGWKFGEIVPYCSYCQIRCVKDGEERCILANPDPLPAFQATMPTYKGVKESFEMSLSPFILKDQKYWVLVLRNPKWTTEIQLKIKQLLIHDTMSAQEAERMRIARELHDHIGQTVYSAFLGLQSIKSYIQNKDFISHLKKMEAGLEKTLEDIKRLSKEIHPSTLEHLGLETALRRSAENWSLMYGIECTSDIDLKQGTYLSKEHSLHIYRIIQEAVHNAVRHGHPSLLTIQLKVRGNKLTFKIFDNGIGFDVKNMHSKGLGQYYMIERIHMIGGEIEWLSEKGKFTIVEGYVPLD